MYELILVGNDGVGKTTIAELYRKSFQDEATVSERHPVIDQWTLDGYPWTRGESDPILDLICPDRFIIVLDLDPETAYSRIKARNSPNDHIWDTPRALEYYARRFRELGYYYGFPVINTDRGVHDIVRDIHTLITGSLYHRIQACGLYKMTPEQVAGHSVESRLLADFDDYFPDVSVESMIASVEPEFTHLGMFDLGNYRDHIRKIYVKWYLHHSKVDSTSDGARVIHEDGTRLTIPETADGVPIFHLLIEGESKQVYQVKGSLETYFQHQVFIRLKPTIYSHSRQSTGEFPQLEQVRAFGTMYFLEMMNRNGINHAYSSINSRGLIISDRIYPNPLEIVFKCYCEGTDKHSYYRIREDDYIVAPSGEYKTGVYIRFDWRNPNHLISGVDVRENYFYYLVEELTGKDQFFDQYLRPREDNPIVPFGDRTINPDMLHQCVDVSQIKETALKLYSTMSYYLNQTGIQIRDGCVMITGDGKQIWSEVNQDCMRLKPLEGTGAGYDKDIWRAGGSGSIDTLIDKWTHFNQIMSDYFRHRTFHREEIFSDYAYKIQIDRMIHQISEYCRADYLGIYSNLLNSGTHRKRVLIKVDTSDPDWESQFNIVKVYNDIVLVDAGGQHRDQVLKYAVNHYIHVDTPVASASEIQTILSSSARRVVVSENLADSAPSDRIIIRCRLDNPQCGESVLIDVDPGCRLGVEDLCKFLRGVPGRVDKVYIDLDHTDLSLQQLWCYHRVVPVISARDLSRPGRLGQLYAQMGSYRNGKIDVVVQDCDGIVHGVKPTEYIDVQDLPKMRGLQKLSFNCEGTALLAVVEGGGEYSFGNQSIIKTNLSRLYRELPVDSLEHMSPDVNLTRLIHDFWDLVGDSHAYEDFFLNFLYYLRSRQVEFSHLSNILNAKRWTPRIQRPPPIPSEIVHVGITCLKYQSKTIQFLRTHLGIALHERTGRSLKYTYDVVDPGLYHDQFGDRVVQFVGMKPKDMPVNLISGNIDSVVTYSTVLEDHGDLVHPQVEVVDPDICLALIKRSGDSIVFGVKHPVYIATEHIRPVRQHLDNLGIDRKSYRLEHLMGSSESMLVNQSKLNWMLCDSIVESGQTLSDNQLEIWQVLRDYGTIRIGFYTASSSR